MKKIALVLFLLFSLCVPAYAVNFVGYVEPGEEGASFYVDIDSIELRKTNNNEYIVARIKEFSITGEAEGPGVDYEKIVAYGIDFVAFSKDTKQWQILHRCTYNEKNKILYEESYPFQEANYWTMDRYREMLFDFVMNYYNKNKNKK